MMLSGVFPQLNSIPEGVKKSSQKGESVEVSPFAQEMKQAGGKPQESAIGFNGEKNIAEVKVESEATINKMVADKIIGEGTEVSEKNSSPLTRRIALQTFLKKMKEELGVQPEQLIEAFSQMSTEDLMLPPQDSIDALLEQLPLDHSEQETARLLFHQMLKQTANTSLAEYLKDADSDISIEVLSRKDLRTRRLQKDLDRLSHQFFVDHRGLVDKTSMQAVHQSIPNDQLGLTHKNLQTDNKEDTNFFATPLVKMPQTVSSTPNSGAMLSSSSLPNSLSAPTQGAEVMASNIQPSTFSNLFSPAEVTQDIEAPLETLSMPKLEPPPFQEQVVEAEAMIGGEEGFALEDLEGLEASPKMEWVKSDVRPNTQPAPSPQLNSIAGMSVQNEDVAGGDEGTNSESEYVQVSVGQTGTREVNAEGEFIVNPAPKANPTEQAANVREVVNQAQYLIRKGGGEMRVKLAPQGIGEISMKVNVKNGIVNVEMIADTKEAQKILEGGLSDLKATLASHKLSVDQIKVDSSHNLLNDLNNRNNEAERQFAQQFMDEFRRNNQSWRHGFFDVSGARAYASQTGDEAQNPFLQANGYKRPTQAERRLDLVA